jgi:hypothetical protein
MQTSPACGSQFFVGICLFVHMFLSVGRIFLCISTCVIHLARCLPLFHMDWQISARSGLGFSLHSFSWHGFPFLFLHGIETSSRVSCSDKSPQHLLLPIGSIGFCMLDSFLHLNGL